jgi:CYTH domain-containing protein
MQPPHKYARIERERRFLLDRFPGADVVRVRRITDRYLDGTRLRLREQIEGDGPAVYKLTQKVPARTGGAQQGSITNIYLAEEEFRLLAQLPAKMLRKVRYSVPPFGIDVFEGALEGLRLAEAEFDSDAEADALILPEYILREVTDDARFTGGQLVCASRADIEGWLTEYGLTLSDPQGLRVD